MAAPPKLEWGPRRLKEFVNDVLIPWCCTGRPLRSLICEVHEGPDGTLILPEPGGIAGIGDGGRYPFQVVTAPPPEGSEGEPGWVKVALHSMLLRDLDPTKKITITGLDEGFQLDEAWQHIWLAVDLSATYDEPPGDVTASIEHGEDWNGPGGDFFPLPVEYDTDDGTRLGSSGEPPENTKQIKFFLPIAYTVPTDADPFLLAGKAGFSIGANITLIQQLRSHLILAETCFDAGSVRYASPFHAPFPEHP